MSCHKNTRKGRMHERNGHCKQNFWKNIYIATTHILGRCQKREFHKILQGCVVGSQLKSSHAWPRLRLLHTSVCSCMFKKGDIIKGKIEAGLRKLKYAV